MIKELIQAEIQPQKYDKRADWQNLFIQTVPNCLICFLLGLLISGASFNGKCFIGGVSFVGAVGAGLHGACALIGICIGYPLLYGFENTFHYIAAGIFVYTIAYLCQYIHWYRSPYFMSLVVTGMVTLIRAFGAVDVVRGNGFPSSELLLEIITGGILTCLYTITVRHHSGEFSTAWKLYSFSAIFATILMSLAPVRICDVISVAEIAAVLVYLLIVYYSKGPSYPIAMMFGLALRYSSNGGEPILLLFFLCSFAEIFQTQHSKIGLCIYLSCVSAVMTALYGLTEELVIQWIENLIAVLLFALAAPRKSKLHHSVQSISKSKQHPSDELLALAELMRDISVSTESSDSEPGDMDMNLNTVIDRAVEEICEHCDKKAICWTNHYFDMVSVFENAVPNIRRRGKMLDSDLPDYFTRHCECYSALVMAVNYELRRYYNDRKHLQTDSEHMMILSHTYMQFAEILEKTAEQLHTKKHSSSTDCMHAEIGIASKRKAGESVCGDSFRYFKTAEGKLYIILSDGIGTGVFAEKQSSRIVSIVERALRILDSPDIAIQLANAALWKSENATWEYATIDLVEVDLHTGKAYFYKMGASDSYILKGDETEIIRGNAYSAGGTEIPGACVACHSTALSADTILLMASDGAELSDISSLSHLIYKNRKNMKSAAKDILLSANQDDSDDKTVIVLSLSEQMNGS